MTLDTFVKETKPLLEQAINSHLSERFLRYQTLPFAEDVFQTFKRIAKDGKMLRGMLVLLLSEKDGHFDKGALDSAVSLELFHLGLLIHDDIMDDDTKRRGNKTVHMYYKEVAEKKSVSQAKEYGTAIGICIGDLAFFLPISIISDATISSEKKVEIIKTIATELQFTGFAQIADVHFGKFDSQLTEDDIFSVYLNKTARYSFSLPLVVGAILHNKSQETRRMLHRLGELIGLMYQIRDDELSLFGEASILGKSIGSDIKENKKTIFRQKLFELCTMWEKQRLLRIFGNKNVSEKEIEYVQSLFEKKGIIALLAQKVAMLSEDAKKLLKQIPIEDSKKEVLSDLIYYIVTRKK